MSDSTLSRVSPSFRIGPVLRRALVLCLLSACGDDSDPSGGAGATGSGGAGATGSTGGGGPNSTGVGGTGSTGSTVGGSSSTGSGKEAVCEAYAQLAIDCCDPPVPNCAPDQYEGWKQFCMKGYEGCEAAYDCLAEATCATKDACPDFASACM